MEIFKQEKISYWVDSGALLGLVRDGKLIDWDNDIDIGIIENELEKFSNLIRQLKRKKFRILILKYHGNPFKFKIVAKDLKKNIDINIFYENEDFFYCPQPVDPKIRASFYPFFKVAKRCYKALPKHFNVTYDIGRFPLNKIRDTRFWVYPKRFVKELEQIYVDGTELWIPNQVFEFLEMRYGNWKIPCKNWDFEKNDGALKRKIPF